MKFATIERTCKWIAMAIVLEKIGGPSMYSPN